MTRQLGSFCLVYASEAAPLVPPDTWIVPVRLLPSAAEGEGDEEGRCPFCGASRFEDCDHLLVARGDDADATDWYWELPLPCLGDAATATDDPDAWWATDFSKEELAAAFGDLVGLTAACADLRQEPDRYQRSALLDRLVERLALPIAAVPWESDSRLGPVTWSGTRYYAEQAAQAKAAVETLVAQLRAGFVRLAAQARGRLGRDAGV